MVGILAMGMEKNGSKGKVTQVRQNVVTHLMRGNGIIKEYLPGYKYE